MFGPIERTLIYHPVLSDDLSPPPSTAFPHAQAREIFVPSSQRGLGLNGWHILRDEPESSFPRASDMPRLLTLFFPGNGGNRAYRIPEIDVLLEAGTDVLIVDYRGYGDNAGSPSEAAIAADAGALWRYAQETLGIPSDRIILFGESLGGGVATRLASERCVAGTAPAGLILRSTFTRLTDVAAEHYPWLPVKLVMGERYPSVDRIARITCPILILHGERDTVVRFSHGLQLFEAAPEESSNGTPKEFVTLPSADHNDVLAMEADRFRDALFRFIRHIGAESASDHAPVVRHSTSA